MTSSNDHGVGSVIRLLLCLVGLAAFAATARAQQPVVSPNASAPDNDQNVDWPSNLNWQEAKAWKKDGSLVVTVVTMIDGAGSSITATRTVVVGFDRAGRIVKSSNTRPRTNASASVATQRLSRRT
jgi:hypothetical protein